MEGIEERIRSRLGWGLVADIHPTDYELRLGILQAKAESLSRRTDGSADGARIPQPVLEFLAQRIVTNIRELEGALNRVIAYASFVGRPVTLEMAQDVLRDLLRASDRRVTIDEIQRRVAEYFNVKMGDMLSARRARSVARPRQIAMYLSKQLTTRSLPEIGRKFGGRDHTRSFMLFAKLNNCAKKTLLWTKTSICCAACSRTELFRASAHCNLCGKKRLCGQKNCPCKAVFLLYFW